MRMAHGRIVALLAVALVAGVSMGDAAAQAKLKVGLMLPYTGTYAALGTAIENGFRLRVQEQGGRLGGREIEYYKVDDESDPSKATDNVNRLIKRDQVDVLVGTVHSGVAMAMAKAAQGMITTLHYADSLNTARDNAFRLNYAKTFKLQPDVYAVQGYDAAQLLGVGLAAVRGDLGRRAELVAAMEKAKIDSPRGPFTLSKSHNPVQDIYLRKVEGKENKLVGVAVKGLADPGRGCRM
jgi:ABC-type branched-subunit amino acid transport system substrate-binding protein